MNNGIVLTHVSFGYTESPDVLSDISLTIKKGAFLGITGVNGSGKSTLMQLFNGLIPHSTQGVLTGDVFVDGISTKKKGVSYFAKHVGMVFQNPDYSLFNLTVEEEIAFGLKNLQQTFSSTDIDAVLDQVGLSGFASRNPQTLSFGEKQKVCLASVLALNVSYVILDEPTATLDYKSSVALYDLLKKLHHEGKTIITIEHDTDFLWDYTDQMVILDSGKIQSYGATKKVLSQTSLLTTLGIKRPHGGMR
jgi:energy-coupling factor transporter ATP-binding protein EcfA2